MKHRTELEAQLETVLSQLEDLRRFDARLTRRGKDALHRLVLDLKHTIDFVLPREAQLVEEAQLDDEMTSEEDGE